MSTLDTDTCSQRYPDTEHQPHAQLLENILIGHQSLLHWHIQFCHIIKDKQQEYDPAHRLDHFQRVAKLAIDLAIKSDADLAVIIPAAWLHDFIAIPKDHPKRKQASTLSSQAAIEYLASVQYPKIYYPAIANAISAHSYSANIPATSLEAKIIQDADRLDAIGAIGLLRCFSCGGTMGRTLYDLTDPFAHHRQVDDKQYSIDHIYEKLLKIADNMQTPSAQAIAKKRKAFMLDYLQTLAGEI